MEFLKKFSRSLILGSIVGLGIALVTSFFLQELIDRIEYLTYYMRYSWQFSDVETGEQNTQKKRDPDVCIIDIDDRSQQKLGWYANWNRSYHAKMLRSLKKHHPAAVIFDINFYDPEDTHHAQRLNTLLERSREKNPNLAIKDTELQAIVKTIDYDKQFAAAMKECGNTFQAVRMSDERDYEMVSQIEYKGTPEWHNALNPASTLTIPKSDSELKIIQKPFIDGIFPEFAQNAKAIGHVNVPPNEDGVVREIPLLYRFDNTDDVYLPISVRAAATLFGTPNEEIIYKAGKYIDIGSPFKIWKNTTGTLRFSYPNITEEQLLAIKENKDRIEAIDEDKEIEITHFLTVKIGDDGKPMAFMNYPGELPFEVVKSLIQCDMKKVIDLPVSGVLEISPGITMTKDSEVEWILNAPYGYEEWYLTEIDLKTLAKLRKESFANLKPGENRLVFHTCTVTKRNGKLLTSIPVLRTNALNQLLDLDWNDVKTMAPGERKDLGDHVYIPLTPYNTHIITFFGPKKTPFTYYSYYDIMEDRIQGSLEGKVFVVGSTAPSMFDLIHAPLDKVYPGVEIHASLFNSFLSNHFVTRLSDFQNLLILLAVGILIGFVGYMLKPLFGAIITIFSILAYLIVAMTVFDSTALWIEVARPILTIILTFTAIMAYRYITEEKDKKFLQSTFKAYLSPELIDQMYKEKQSPQLGGDEGVRTAYFTDIQSFSTFSEKLGSPTRLVELLNEYLTAMTDILLNHYGTLDKYEGDAIIAFYGAPMPMEDHAQQACYTALAMQSKLGELRRKWASEGDKWPRIVHEMRMRIGINTGPITTGNMGSAVRMNYTMMGDAVNLAARLESAAKQYGVYSMFSQFTYDLVKNDVEARQVDKIQVVGKSEPVVVYELMAKKGDLTEDQIKMLEDYKRGLELFYDQQWDAAIDILSQSEKMEPYREISVKGMSPSKKIIGYCEQFKANPPGNDWDGTIRLTSK